MIISFLKKRLRLVTQLIFTLLTNINIAGFFTGMPYDGATKSLCVPGLNCYSCPAALFSCPIGALQSGLAGRRTFPMMAAGFIIAVGAATGRLVCGWLCPFGLLQELLYKIPFFKKLRSLPGEKGLRYIKYILLVVFVIALPLFAPSDYNVGSPSFCKYICPAGTLTAGVPMLLVDPLLQPLAGELFWIKLSLAVLIIVLTLLVLRPFCRYMCPLGAIYGLLQKVSIYRYHFEKTKCTDCGACARACKLALTPNTTPNSAECIRCGECVKACPTGALKRGHAFQKSNKY